MVAHVSVFYVDVIVVVCMYKSDNKLINLKHITTTIYHF